MQLIQFMAVVQVVFSWPLLLSPLLNPGLLYVALDERQQNKHTCICVHQVIHGDLALRNIMVHSFPSEVKLTEFGLARDLTYMRSRRGIRKGVDKNKVPLRWYPPEFFQHNTYSFKGDVWSYGILLWEMETFGTLPYPDMDNSDEVIRNVCSGYRNVDPEFCRPEICQMMRSCWLDPFSLRPSFKDIVRILENILENDHDYVTVESIGQGFFSVTSDR